MHMYQAKVRESVLSFLEIKSGCQAWAVLKCTQHSTEAGEHKHFTEKRKPARLLSCPASPVFMIYKKI